MKTRVTYDKAFILSRIEIDPGTWCWNWKRSKSNMGYPLMGRRSGFGYAHRLAYCLWREHPGDLCVCHRCDNPACVNPDHLFLGTHADNMADAASKGRMPNDHDHNTQRGEAHVLSKLTERDIYCIRASDDTQRVLAVRFGVSQQSISEIRMRLRWAHLP